VPRPGGHGTVRALPVDQLLDSLSVRLNGPKAGDATLSVNLNIFDTGQSFLVRVVNGVFHSFEGQTAPDADQTVTLSRNALVDIVLKEESVANLIAAGEAKAEGAEDALAALVDLLDVFDFWFEIVMP